MSDSKKPKLSEIVWRNAVGIKSLRNDKGTIGGEGALAISEGVQYDTPYLLDLVKKLRKVIDSTTVWCGDDPCYRTRNGVPQRMPAFAERIMKEARALLEEIKQ